MTKREIVKNAILHIPQKAIPYCIQLADDATEKYADIILKDFDNDVLQKVKNNPVITTFDRLQLAFENDVFTVSPPWWNWYMVPDKFITNLNPPDETPHTIGIGSYEEFAEKIKLIKELTGCYILATIWGSHFEKAQFLRGIENFLADMGGAPEFSQGLLDTIIRKNLVMLENFINIPEVDGVLLGSDWGSQKSMLISPDMWREMIAPGELKEYKLIKSAGKDVWIHSCGHIEPIIPDLIDMGADVLNPVQPECMDIYKIKKQYGKNMTYWGGISTQVSLPMGSVRDVIEESERVIKGMSEGGGYITASSQQIQADVPYENLCALLETAKKYRNL